MTSRFVPLICVALFLPLFVFLPSIALGQSDPGFFCETSDSSLAIAGDLDGLLHQFGTDTFTYPHEFDISSSYPVFDKIFDLYLSDHVSGRWSSSDFQTLISSIVDNDSTLTDDVFGIDWSYFLRSGADGNAYHAGVRFTVFGNTFTKIKLRLYSAADLPTPCTGGYGYACNGYSFYSNGTNIITINATASNSMDVVLKMGIAHELQHLIYNANGYPNGYENMNETLSTLAEYFNDGWRDHIFDLPYDGGIMRYETCDANSKYELEKIWIVYLYEVFKGNPSDPTDDLVYRWIHSATSASTRLRLSGLATELWDSDFDWLGGTDATDRLNKVLANFLAAKFCNATAFGANGQFGMDGLNTVKDFGLFLDNCDYYAPGATPLSPVDCPDNPLPGAGHAGCWNVRVLVPEYTLGNAAEDNLTLVSGIYEDGDAPGVSGDGSTDYIDVAMTGTDYVVFRAGSYYDDDGEHELEIRVSGDAELSSPPYPSSSRIKPVGWVIGYSANDDTLQVHPEHIIFIQPITFSPESTAGDSVVARPVIVTDFGRSVKAVVLAIGATPMYPNNATISLNRFIYKYKYGVFTPAATTRSWEGDVYATGDVTVPSGGTLDIAQDTHVKIYDSDLAGVGADEYKIEFNVEGELVADGAYLHPVKFDSWDGESSSDWVGLYCDSLSDGITANECKIEHASIGIESYVPITLNHTTIDSCVVGIVARYGNSLIQNSYVHDIDYLGIVVEHNVTTVRNTSVGIVGTTGIDVRYPGSVVMRNSGILGADTGMYLQSLTTAADIDSSCNFSENVIGLHCYNTSTNVSVKQTSFEDNTDDALLCDNASSPMVNGDFFDDNGVAVHCSNSSSPTIKNSSIQHSDNGIVVESSSNPDIGHYSTTGNNEIAYTRGGGKYVYNYTGGTIYAQNNCWNVNTGGCAPSSGKFSGSVDRSNPICCSVSEMFVYQMPKQPSEAAPHPTQLTNIVPNPFNPVTTIHYDLGAQSKVEINIYDVAGRLVRDLVHETKVAGSHEAVWNGRDRTGNTSASGVYFVRMIAGNQVFTKKMVMLK